MDAMLKLDAFLPLPGQHCESSTLRMMLAHAGHSQTEAMVFGLGQGLDFVIWPCRDTHKEVPILSGRVDSCMLSRQYAANTGVELVMQEADTFEYAHAQAMDILRQGRVAGLKLDIFYLPYFSAKRHFCAHFLALHAVDMDHAWVVDTEQQGGSHRIPLSNLIQARASMHGLQASRNLSMFVASTRDSWPLAEALLMSIRGCAQNYLQPSNATRGVLGLQNLLLQMPNWWQQFDDPTTTIMSIANFWEFAGTGGANFRRLYAQFLREAQEVLCLPHLGELVDLASKVEQGWSDCIRALREIAQCPSEESLHTIAKRFAITVDLERELMLSLFELSKV